MGLVQSYGADLKTVQELFLQNRDSPPKSWNLPPIAGALTWCRGLVERIQIPMTGLQQLDRMILDREEAKEVTKVRSASHGLSLDTHAPTPPVSPRVPRARPRSWPTPLVVLL